LRETAQIVSAQLDGKLDLQDKDIVAVEVEEFMKNIDTIRTAVESHMEQNVVLLCQILGSFEDEKNRQGIIEKYGDANFMYKYRSNAAAGRPVGTSSSDPNSSDGCR
jgi:hypothetical protein